MRSAGTVLLLFLAAVAVFGQEQIPQNPDYSKPALIRILASEIPPPETPHNVQWHPGYVEFKALNMRWRLSYLPFLMPFQGSVPTTQGLEIPNPFILTGTELPYTPRTWHDTRAMSKELQRIERSERERARLKVQLQ